MSLWPTPWSPSVETALLVLLIAGHVLADFLVQTRAHVEAKRQGGGYLTHGTAVFATHMLLILPVLSVPVSALVLGISLLHVAVDWLRYRMVGGEVHRFRHFVLDQTMHLALVYAGWAAVVAAGSVPDVRWLSPAELGSWVGWALLASAFAFNATGGSVIVTAVLDLLASDGRDPGQNDRGVEPAGYEGAGRLIGILERTLVLALVLYGQWEAVALLVAAKSIARFEEIKVRRFAEYYLVGTLTSLLVALAIGFLLGEGVFPLLA